MLYIGVIWNTISSYRKKVIDDINKCAAVLLSFDYDLGELYNKFVEELYCCDNISKWKVDKKIQAMSLTPSKSISILFIEIDDSMKIYNPKKNKVVAINVENLKAQIRQKYSLLIPNYYFDNIFHMTDDEEELKGSLEVIARWFPEIYLKYQELIPNNSIERRRFKDENK